MIVNLQNNDRLNEYLIKAVAFHLAVLILAVVLNTLLNLNLFKTKIHKKHLEIIQSSVRVDIVDLPKMTLQELKKIKISPEEAQPKVEEKGKVTETSKIEFKKKTKRLDLSNLLNSLSSKKVKIKTKNIKRKKNINSAALKNLVLEGNKVSKGVGITGNEVNLGQQEYISYIQGLPDRIRPNWKLPSYLISKDLKCRIRVFIASNGNVIKTEIFESSGDSEYDKKAIEAIKFSSPLPKPIREILLRVAGGDIVLGFPL